ncbi:hypothetical protein HYFRA_00014038 [Hymenoscyphus fraxineus]|uniref:Ankyrin n=1 Tax=Hymenoscyphus fraxineus TaxID=746836 RepID=A0A9N9LCR9_9HELO|nr:hypothetical protein HYFRA_00014038 [Hymenoscyphus fraxineus]
MFLLALAALTVLVPVGSALGTAKEWEDFTNNFATDLAPIIVLFGEQVSKQFLSESTSIWDNIIFGMAPLGVITAIVSAIRVYGNASLKAFIGRAQEAHGQAEAELCSSTSDDVCELWSNGGFCRVFGRPKILEFVHTKKNAQFYNTGEDEHPLIPATCGIFPAREFFSGQDISHYGWNEVDQEVPGRVADSEDPQSSKPRNFAPYPNLSLNIGIKKVPLRVLWAAATFGICAQLSFFGFATWITFYKPDFYENDNTPKVWSFVLAISGTAFLVFGMTSCAFLIERNSMERRFELDQSKDMATTRFFWLQPGRQRAGDQLFNAFAYSEVKQNFVTSWKADHSEQPNFISRHMILVLWAAVVSSSVGFICQFVGFRNLHGSIALYQLAITLLMAILRSFLRYGRLKRDSNKLEALGMKVEGHELDWQVMELEKAPLSLKTRHSGLRGWLCRTASTHDDPRDDYNGDKSIKGLFIVDEPYKLSIPEEERAKQYHYRVSTASQLLGGPSPFTCASAIYNERESFTSQDALPNEAARLLMYRARMTHLTETAAECSEQIWDSEVRQVAVRLQNAIQQSAQYVFKKMKFKAGWDTEESLIWSTTCQLLEKSYASPLPIYFHMHLDRESEKWLMSHHQLEAILGLWSWSLERLSTEQQTFLFSEKAFAVSEIGKKDELDATIRMWVNRNSGPSVHSIKGVLSDSAANRRPTTLSIPLRSFAWHSKEQDVDPKMILLSIPTKCSHLQLIAQDIFTIFISRIADIIEPIEDLETTNIHDGSVPTGTLEDVTNEHISSIVDIFVSINLGSREDALASIVPPLLQRSKLPNLDEVVQKVLHRAKHLRRKKQLRKATGTITTIMRYAPPQLQENGLRSLGEVYREALRSRAHDGRASGTIGLFSLCTSPPGLQISPSQKADQVRDYYREVERFYKRGNSRLLSDRADMKKLDVKDIVSKAVMPLALILMDSGHLANRDSAELWKILKWAVNGNCPELIEDMWGCELANDGERAPEAAVFLAIQSSPETETLERLLEWPNLELNLQNKSQKTPLSLAIELGNVMAVKLLIKHGANIDMADVRGLTPIQMAIENRQQVILEDLLAAGATTDTDNQPPLAMAADWSQSAVELLLKYPSDSHVKDLALRIACMKERIEIAEILLQNGATPFLPILHNPVFMKHPLSLAISSGHIGVVELLLAWYKREYAPSGEFPSMLPKDREYPSLLHKAAVASSPRIVELLLEYNVPRGTDPTALLFAVERGHEEAIEPLLRVKEEINIRGGEDSVTPLHVAAERGNTSLLSRLLENGADANLKDKFDRTPRMLAEAKGHEEVARILMRAESEG